MSEMSIAIVSMDAVMHMLHETAIETRKLRKKCQAKGIKAAQKKGVKFGRPRRELPESFYNEMIRWQQGETTLAESAMNCGMPISTFYAKIREQSKGK